MYGWEWFPRLSDGRRRVAFVIITALVLITLYIGIYRERGLGLSLSSTYRKSSGKAGASSQTHVLTFAYNMEERARPLMNSWSLLSPCTNIVIFGSKNETVKDRCRTVRYIFVKMPARSTPHLHRLKVYQDFLAGAIAEGSISADDRILITDARDAVLQTPFFTHPVTEHCLTVSDLLFSKEGSRGGQVTFREDTRDRTGSNRRWISVCFGSEALQALERCDHCHVICSGAFAGKALALVDFLRIVDDTINTLGSECTSTVGADQGIFNFIIWLGILRNTTLDYHVANNWESPIFTLGYGSPYAILRSGLVIPEAARHFPSLLHQYDRNEELYAYIQKRYQDFKNETTTV